MSIKSRKIYLTRFKNTRNEDNIILSEIQFTLNNINKYVIYYNYMCNITYFWWFFCHRITSDEVKNIFLNIKLQYLL